MRFDAFEMKASSYSLRNSTGTLFDKSTNKIIIKIRKKLLFFIFFFLFDLYCRDSSESESSEESEPDSEN